MLSLFLDPDATAGPLIPGMGQIPSGPVLASNEEGELIHMHTCTCTYMYIIVILYIWKLTRWFKFYYFCKYTHYECFSLPHGRSLKLYESTFS